MHKCMLKAYKYRMYPTKEQEEMFFQHFGSCRFIYNWTLAHKIKSYEQDGKPVSRFTLNNMLTGSKDEAVSQLIYRVVVHIPQKA